MDGLRLGRAGAGTLLKEVHIDVDVVWVDRLGLAEKGNCFRLGCGGDGLGKSGRAVADEDDPLVE